MMLQESILATLGEIITEKAGNLNLGVEGMMLMGAVIGFMIGLKIGNPMLAIAASMVAGGSREPTEVFCKDRAAAVI